MSKLKAIIVDDEKDSRESLLHYIHTYCKNVTVISEANSIIEAKKQIEASTFDLLFLDIEMPFGNAFDLLESLDNITFEIIFVTAFSDYAIQALNMSAAHYLLKPLDIDDLIMAVEKVESNVKLRANYLHASVLLENLSNENDQTKKLVLPLIDGFEVIKLKDIIYCASNDNFTEFYLRDKRKLMICRSLKHFESVLSDFGFCRIHRSYLINLDYVTRYKKGKGGSVILSNNKELDVSNSKKMDLISRFKQ